MERIIYPVGIQTFSEIIDRNYVYVDKTRYIYELLVSGYKHVFLSRPRRFGKSLFLSTLKSFFQGDKELFKGLYIYDRPDIEWEKYPVIHFDLSGSEATNPERLEQFLHNRLAEYEESYGLSDKKGNSIGDRFGMLIKGIAQKTGKLVVILVDEYDKGITEVLENAEKLEKNQEVLRPFFSQLKGQDEHIRFSMLTGVARFRHYTLFSGLNQLEDISMKPEFAAICGMTFEELVTDFQPGIRALGDENGWSYEEALEELRLKYDSYRFTRAPILVFNPFSLIRCLKDRDLASYWLGSGTSRVFWTYLTRSNFTLDDIEGVWKTQKELEAVFSDENPISLLFQAGYLTIKDYDEGEYKLGIPNGEVREALVEDLMPEYMGMKPDAFNADARKIHRMLQKGDPDGFLSIIQGMMKGVSYHELDLKNLEKSYHLTMHMIFMMLNVKTRSEIAQSEGRVDMVVETKNFVYVMEFKLDRSAEDALRQINDKGYALPWESRGRKVFKIGISFSSEARCIDSWVIEK